MHLRAGSAQGQKDLGDREHAPAGYPWNQIFFPEAAVQKYCACQQDQQCRHFSQKCRLKGEVHGLINWVSWFRVGVTSVYHEFWVFTRLLGASTIVFSGTLGYINAPPQVKFPKWQQNAYSLWTTKSRSGRSSLPCSAPRGTRPGRQLLAWKPWPYSIPRASSN